MISHSLKVKCVGTAAAALFCVGLIATASTKSRADEVVVGHLSVVPVENIKAAIPHQIKLSEKKPASITVEPTYRGKPLYGAVTLGSSSKAAIPVVLDTFPGDKMPKLYVDLAGTGNLLDKADFFTLVPQTEFSHDNAHPASVVSTTNSTGAPLGAMAETLARYDIKGEMETVRCPVLFTLIGDELDYSLAVQHLGTVNVSGRAYRIALVDTHGNAVFDNVTHAEDKPANVNIMIDRNNSGKFDPIKDKHDLAKPFRLAGAAYEVTSVDATGTIIALQTTTKHVEGGITPDQLAVGTDIIEFVAKTMDGQTVSFPANYKHHIVLLDFWATWCGPCMAEVPNVVAVYNRYHQYGFDILGVSLDRENMADQVRSVCSQNNMTWPQIYDGRYWNAEIAKLYEVDSIPRAFLVDGDTGAILAMGNSLRGEGLEAAVTKALQKKQPARSRR